MNDTITSVTEILFTISGDESINGNPDINLIEEAPIDSLKFVELIVALSEKFEVYISPMEVEREAWATPRLIASFIVAKKNEEAPVTV